VPEKFSDRVFAVVRRIPRGKVASYKLVGAMAGSPNAARHVGRIMRFGHGLPWWRVLAQDGRIVIMNPQWRFEQMARLEAEGVPVVDGKVDYARFSWKPRDAPASRSRKAASPPGAPRARPRAIRGQAKGTSRPPRAKRGRA
jgi:methylated-DNA-protein-cysteine methyltransferase related protein